jgi:hypothetical protein
MHVCKFSGDRFIISDCMGVEISHSIEHTIFREPETTEQKAVKERDAKIKKLVDLYYFHNTGKFLEDYDVMNVVTVLVDNGAVIGKGE